MAFPRAAAQFFSKPSLEGRPRKALHPLPKTCYAFASSTDADPVDMTTSSANIPNGRHVFISYARSDDEPYVKRLASQLQQTGHDVWWDRQAMESRGLTFLQEIKDAISTAERVLLIVGPETIASPYVELEWRHALREGVVVTPLLRLGDYGDVPPALRSLHCEDVRDSVPRQDAFQQIVRILSTRVPDLGALIGVPRLPTPYLDRAERLDALRARVLIDAFRPVDLEPDQRITSLTGMGGVGKSVLAAALAQLPEVRRSFQDGVFWVSVGRDAPPLETLVRIGVALQDPSVDRYSGLAEARLLIGKALASRNCLILLDDVWSPDVPEALHTAAGKKVRILMTGRRSKLFASAGVHEVAVDELTIDEALELQAGWAGIARSQLPAEAELIAEKCGRLPLALSMIGAMIRGRPDRWGHALERLRRADLSAIRRKLPDYRYETLDRAMLVSFEDLNDHQRQCYLDFAAIPEDVAAPSAMLCKWWRHAGMDELDAIEMLDDLVERSLLRMDVDGGYILHDIQREFLVMRVGDERMLHRRWLEAFEPASGKWAMAEDDRYLFGHLDHHLLGAGRESDWRALLVSFAWLQRKTEVLGFAATLRDLARFANDPLIGALHRVCRRMAHIIANDPSQFAAQLIARIESPGGLDSLLESARLWLDGPWLRPMTASLSEGNEATLAVFRGREEDGHAGTPRTVTLSSDLRLIASGGGSSNDLTVKIWSADAGILLRTIDNAIEPGERALLCFLDRNRFLAVARRADLSIHPVSGDPKQSAYRGFGEAFITCIVADGMGDALFVGLQDGRVARWNPASNEYVELRAADGTEVLALAHAPLASRLFVATPSRIEFRDDTCSRLFEHLDAGFDNAGAVPFQAPLFTATTDGASLFFGEGPLVWCPGKDSGRRAMKIADIERVVALSADAAFALTAPEGHVLELVELSTGAKRARLHNTREISCLAMAADGSVVATGDFEHDVKLWDLAPGQSRPDTRVPEWSGPVAISDMANLAVLLTPQGPKYFDMTSGCEVQPGSDLDPDCLERRGKNSLDEATVHAAQERLEELIGHPGDGPISSFVPKLRVLATSAENDLCIASLYMNAKFADVEEPQVPFGDGEGYPLELWDLKRGVRLSGLAGHTMPVSCGDMTADAQLALTGSVGRLLRLWDLDARKCLHVLRGHRGEVFDIALTDDARLGISGSEDMTVRLWDLDRGELLFTFAASSAVRCCDISRDGRCAIAVESSGRVHFFSVIVQ